MPTQDQIVKARENRVWYGHQGLTGTIVKGDIYCDQVTVRWDDKHDNTRMRLAALHSVHGSPTWIDGDAHYPDGSIVTAAGDRGGYVWNPAERRWNKTESED